MRKTVKGKKYVLTALCLSFFLLFLYVWVKATPQKDQKRIKKWEEDLAKLQTPVKPIKLRYSHSLPLEKDSEKVYFKAVENFTVDAKEFVYVSDARMNMITVFNADGNFVRQIGRQGQGPGEFNNPKAVCIDELGQIIVSDSNNGRVQFFSPEGVYKNSFRLFVSSAKMAVKNNRLYMCHSPRKDEEKIIRVLNYEGKKLYDFCDIIKKYGEYLIANKVNISINDKNEIFLAWEFLPTVRKYSENGSLLAEYAIDYLAINKRFKQNIKSFADKKVSLARKTFYINICDIEAKNYGFYLMRYYPVIEILEYDQSGKLIHVYHADQPYNLIAEDFFVLDKGKEKYFYIACNFPEERIDVFKMPHN